MVPSEPKTAAEIQRHIIKNKLYNYETFKNDFKLITTKLNFKLTKAFKQNWLLKKKF